MLLYTGPIWEEVRSQSGPIRRITGPPVLCAPHVRLNTGSIDESYSRDTDDIVLLCFLTGWQAQALSGMGRDASVQAMLDELDEMFSGRASATFIDSFWQDWTTEPHIRGAYSFSLVGADLDIRSVLAAPVDDRVFFAGEATNDSGDHATVHGAMETGEREAFAVMYSLRSAGGAGEVTLPVP